MTVETKTLDWICGWCDAMGQEINAIGNNNENGALHHNNTSTEQSLGMQDRKTHLIDFQAHSSTDDGTK